jgi:hypothetical protein
MKELDLKLNVVAKRTITVNGRDFVIRWRSLLDQPNYPGVKSMGCCYTGTIDEYRLPGLHSTIDDLLVTAAQWAKTVFTAPGYLENYLGKPEDLKAFIGSGYVD